MIKKLECVDEAIKILRKVIAKILSMDIDNVLNGESVRGVELVKTLQEQEVPLSNKDILVVFYNEPTNEIDVVENCESCQSYSFHVIIYGAQCRKASQVLRANFYTEFIKDTLSENGVSILDVSTPTSTSEFINNTSYILRNDIVISYNCVVVNKRVEDIDEIESVENELSLI